MKQERLHSYVAVVGSFMAYMVADGATYSFGVFYVSFLEEFKQSSAVTAAVGALMMGLQQFCAPLVCSYVGSFGPRVGAFTGSIILSVAFFVTRFASSINLLYITIGMLASIGLELAYISAIVAVELRFTANLALATGIAVSGSGIGVCLFSTLVEYLVKEYSWRGACTVLAGLCLHLSLSAMLFLPLPKQSTNLRLTRSSVLEVQIAEPPYESNEVKNIDVIQKSKQPDNNNKTTETMKSEAKCLKLRREFTLAIRAMFDKSIYTMRFVRFCLVGIVVAVTILVPFTFLIHKAELSGIKSHDAAQLLSFIGLSSSAGQIILGFVAVKWCKPLHVYIVALSISGSMIIAIPLVSDFGSLAVLSAVFGFFYGAYYALMSTMLLVFVSRKLFTPALAFYALLQGIGVLVVCPLVGFAFDYLRSYDMIFFIAGSALLLSVNVFLLPEALLPHCHQKRLMRYNNSA